MHFIHEPRRREGRPTKVCVVPSCILFFLLLLFCGPLTARAGVLEDSARALAQKIAVSLPAHANFDLEVRNVSSLSPDEVGQMEVAFRNELQNHGEKADTNAAATHILITLSEGLQNFVWTAEIRPGDAGRENSAIVVIAVPRQVKQEAGAESPAVVLHADKLFETPERILDVAMIFESAGQTSQKIVVLSPGALMTREAGTDEHTMASLSPAVPASRSAEGFIVMSGNSIAASIESGSKICTYSQAQAESSSLAGECHAQPAKTPASARIPGRGDQYAEIRSQCGSGIQSLATGAGDDTQSDSVQAFDKTRNDEFIPVGAEVSLPGPVIALHSRSDTAATAIVRNLKTGHYEAYRLYISCAQ